MATLSTHTLNSVDGTHAAAVDITLLKIAPGGERIDVFNSRTDSGGRLSQLIDPAMVDTAADYELVFQTGAYFDKLGLKLPGLRIQKEVVIRFCMPDPRGAYHMPLVMAPSGYSVWLSS
jgi:5-hydroxyisourate hydrolase